mgnify:CR=1 FL=1
MFPTEVANEDASKRARFDVHLLLTIGDYPGILIDTTDKRNILPFDIITNPDGVDMVCSNMGIVEPITYAIYRFLNNEPSLSKYFINTAISTGSFPLLYRIRTAIEHMENPSYEIKSLYDDYVRPMIADLWKQSKITSAS